jgi:hypothetical protein
MSKSKDRFFCKITDDTDWDSFQNYLESSFTADWVNKNNDNNTLWSFWKTKVNGVAECPCYTGTYYYMITVILTVLVE